MITLQTINSIELSSLCNLKCSYCINRLIRFNSNRTPMIMEDRTFYRALEVVAELCAKGTQQEIYLNGNGESLIDPNLLPRIAELKKIVGGSRKVGLCTNGLLINEAIVKGMRDAGLDRLDLSIHSPEHARKCCIIMRKGGIPGVVNAEGILMYSHNWAGQLEHENSVEINFRAKCLPLSEGRGYVTAEGKVTPCCYDYRLLGVYADVFDADIMTKGPKRFELCETCHQIIE